MRLIDGNEFIRKLTLDTSKGFYGEFMDGSEVAYTSREIDNAIENAPTIDAVPVVRCRECKYWLGEHVCDLDCNHETHTGPDDFCSRGQRKEADHEVSGP